MTRQLEDLRAVWHADEDDVCSPDELLARVAHHPPARRRRTVLAAAAAVLVVGSAATIVATRPQQAPRPQTLAGTTAVPDPTITPTTRSTPTPTTRPTPSASRTTEPRATRKVDLGGATVRVPVSWHQQEYGGLPTSLGSADLFLSTRPLPKCADAGTARRGPCLSNTNWFAPGTRTPRDGLVIVWGHTNAIGLTGDGLATVEGKLTTIGGHLAKVDSGGPTRACPTGTAHHVIAYVVSASSSGRPTERLDMTACLGPAVSSADRLALQRMLRTLRISG